ncbi:MAG: Crp/Fnr family transcriptional regulator [Terracidiphilus sp.]
MTQFLGDPTQHRRARLGEEYPPSTFAPIEWDSSRWPYKTGEFFRGLPESARTDFEWLATPVCCQRATILFTEQQLPRSVLCLLEGRVKLWVDSIDGKRLIVGIAGPGEILGLTAAVSGDRYGMTAESLFPCVIARLDRDCFLDFLVRNAVAYRNVARQLSQEHQRSREQLRLLGLSLTAHAKLARLLVGWCAEGQQTENGIRIQCALTHQEIGEHIGVSRETVTRTMQELKKRDLVEQRGATLVVSNFRGLEIFAGAAC